MSERPLQLLTVRDVCEWFQIKPRTLRTWRSDPALNFPKALEMRDGSLRWRRGDLNDWLDCRPVR